MNKEINISILSDVIANKIIDACNLNVNKQKIIANVISEVLMVVLKISLLTLAKEQIYQKRLLHICLDIHLLRI